MLLCHDWAILHEPGSSAGIRLIIICAANDGSEYSHSSDWSFLYEIVLLCIGT